MATDILFTVRRARDVPAPANGKVLVEVNYLRSSTDEYGAAELVPQSTRLELDAGLNGSVRLEGAASPQLQAAVLSADGAALSSQAITADASGNAVMTLQSADVDKIRSGGQQLPADITPLTVTRTARLVPTGSVKVDYARSGVAVMPVKDMQALAASGVDALLRSGGTRITSLEVTGQDLGSLTSLAWTPTHLAVDGTFTAAFTQQPTIGWLWWLIGDSQVLGFMPDNLESADTRIFIIALPALSAPKGAGSATPDTGDGRSVPADVSESEVANNPQIYSEDPGAFCRPFSNPERVLSEKSFSVIARITQPEIGPLGSVKTKTIGLLHLDGDIRAATAPAATPAGRRPAGRGAVAAVAANATATLTIPSRHPLSPGYVDLLKRLPSGRTNMGANNPIQWEDDIAQYQAATPAIGHILEFRVRWRSNGYSLGTVAATLTLAPRQTKRIQKIEWARSDRAVRTESTQLRDQENDSTLRERNYHDQVAANLSEWASGNSSARSSAIAAGLGFYYDGIVGAIGGGASSAHSTSHQNGGRDTTASEEQRLRDSIRRHGDALRKFESTVVSEVTQEETVTGTTEVIRNANYMHSLTVIYYQILRHLKVMTEFAGVRECIFVPFAIKAFDVQRAYRWREALQASIRSPLFSRALRYLKDVATNFTTSDIAPGTRAAQALTYVRGSIYVSLGVDRPRDTADGLFDTAQWAVVQPMLLTPARGIFSQLTAASVADRDRTFQAEHAPSVAARWADKIVLRTTGKVVLHADCTLASRYRFNQSVRIDFAIPASELAGLSRQDLQQLTVIPELGLPPGSVANLTRMSLVYNTQRFEHAVEGRTGTNDLVNPVSGAPNLATVLLPLDNWESVDERLEIRRSVDQLIEHLNEHVEYYHKAIWWHMDRDRLMMLLDGFYIPNTNNVSIASVVDREPVGIIGNSLVYRIGAASFVGYGKVTTPAELYNVYAHKGPVSDPLLISLPTDGLYAQTIMDECVALEEHFGNTDWVLNDKEPDLGAIDPSLMLSRRADQTPATTPTPFPGTIINLQNAPDAPAPSGVQGVLNAVTNPNAFRDMAGLAGTQANAQAALNTAASLATNFGNQAAALEMAKIAKADQATRTADQKIASIKNAVDKGLSTPANAEKATQDVLSAMNPDSHNAEAPHQNPAINSAIAAAKTSPGSTVEASTSEGSVKVTMGEAAHGSGGGAAPSTLSPSASPASIAGVMRDVSRGLTAHPQASLTLVPGRPQSVMLAGNSGWRGTLRCDGGGTSAANITHPMEPGTGPMAVISELSWDDLEVSGGFAAGSPVKLPLTAQYLVATGRQTGGMINNPAHPFFRIETHLECTVQFLFGFVVAPGGAVSPLPPELASATDFTGRVLGSGSSASNIVVLAMVELALCGPLDDWDPLRAVEAVRYYPTTTTWSNKALDEVRTVTTVKRPNTTSMGDMATGAIRSALYTDMNGNINMYPDGSPGDAFVPPWPRWNNLFAHYRTPIAAAGQSFEVVGQKPERTDTAGNRAAYDPITGIYVATTAVKKKFRQGAFDNVHVAPAMSFAHPGPIPPNAYMAPVCQHDCLHTHWRWGDSFGEPRNCGWGPGGPNTVPGAPMVPLNQTVNLTLNNAGNEFTYRSVASSAPAATPQMSFHHGGAYATRATGAFATGIYVIESAQLVYDLAHDTSRPGFVPSWQSFYFHNRWIWAPLTHGYVTRLDETLFAPLEAL